MPLAVGARTRDDATPSRWEESSRCDATCSTTSTRQLRASFRAWLDKEVVPHHHEWEAGGHRAPRAVRRRRAARLPRHGHPRGVRRRRRRRLPLQPGHRRGDPGRRRRRRRARASRCTTTSACRTSCATAPTSSASGGCRASPSGELITAIAMTEPGIGSDLASMSTTAIRDGDHYVVNGSKTFITNGINADLVITAVKTDPSAAPRRDVAARARAGHGRASSAAATSRRSACTRRTPPSCSSPTSPCRSTTCSATRAQGFCQLVAQPAPGAAVDRRRRASPPPAPRSAGRSTT